MKINFFKKENSFKKKDFVLNPNLYWKIAVWAALIAILASFFFGYYLFMQTNQGLVSSNNNPSEQIPTVDKDKLGKVLDYFSVREQKSAEILNSPAPVVDPSL
jgi:hypothetical protein